MRSGMRSWSKWVIFSRRMKSSSSVGPRGVARSEFWLSATGMPWLVVEVHDLLAQHEVFQQGRSARGAAQRVLVVRDRRALVGGQRRVASASHLLQFVAVAAGGGGYGGLGGLFLRGHGKCSGTGAARSVARGGVILRWAPSMSRRSDVSGFAEGIPEAMTSGLCATAGWASVSFGPGRCRRCRSMNPWFAVPRSPLARKEMSCVIRCWFPRLPWRSPAFR